MLREWNLPHSCTHLVHPCSRLVVLIVSSFSQKLRLVPAQHVEWVLANREAFIWHAHALQLSFESLKNCSRQSRTYGAHVGGTWSCNGRVACRRYARRHPSDQPSSTHSRRDLERAPSLHRTYHSSGSGDTICCFGRIRGWGGSGRVGCPRKPRL